MNSYTPLYNKIEDLIKGSDIDMRHIIPYYMVGYITNKFKIEGVKDDINDDTFGIWVSCNCCGNKRYYTIKDGKAKLLRCKQCKKEEVLIPKFEKTEESVNKSFRIVSMAVYRRLKATNRIDSTINLDLGSK